MQTDTMLRQTIRRAFQGFALAILTLLLLAPVALGEQNLPQLYATGSDCLTLEDGVTKVPQAIRWWYSADEKAYYLFLPGSTQTLHLWFEGAKSATVDGKALPNGGDASWLLSQDQFSMQLDQKTYPVRLMRSSNVPALFINTESGSLNYIHRRKGNAETGSLLMTDASGETLYDGALQHIKGRGNATFALNKKAYQIKLEKGTDLCGMGKAKTWILLADFRDNSLLRNKIAFELARAVGLEYTSESQTVDLYINNDYLGAYLLCEKVEIGDTRVDIKNLGKATEKLNDAELDSYKRYGYNTYRLATQKGFQIPTDPEDITGGYLFELDYKMRYSDELSGFVTRRGQAVVVKEPEAASAAQITYISSFFQGFENAVHAADGIDPTSGKHYSEFVNMDSLAKKYILEEVLKNRDANRSSLFFYKPVDEQSTLAFAGPAWDYDASLGNYATHKGDDTLNPETFLVNCDMGEPFYLFPALYAHADFLKAVIKAYQADFAPALEVLLGQRKDESGALLSLDTYELQIEACAAMNFVRWPVFNSKARIAQTGSTYAENIAYLKTFIQKRMAFLNGAWAATDSNP